MKTLFEDSKDITISEKWDITSAVILHEGLAADFIKSIPDSSVQVILTSPPYNVGKEYETKTSIQKYLSGQEQLIDDLIRVLKPEGSVCWQVGNYIDKGEVFPLDIYYYPLFKARGMQLRNRIVWHFGHGLHASKRLSGRYETLLWFSKTDNYVFNLDSVRIPSKYPGKRNFKPGDKHGTPSGNPLGKNPSDIWEFMATEFETGLWDIPNCKSNHPEKTDHPCQFPIELVERCVLAFSNEGDYILDPYSGVGSTVVGSVKQGRKAIGIEKEHDYNIATRKRLSNLADGILKTRAIGTPVHVPSARDKVAQIPFEWHANNGQSTQKS